jgi:hypothetical protein
VAGNYATSTSARSRGVVLLPDAHGRRVGGRSESLLYGAPNRFNVRASFLVVRMASSAVQKALHSAEHHDSYESATSPALRREVHQATGMIIFQLDILATEAFTRL